MCEKRHSPPCRDRPRLWADARKDVLDRAEDARSRGDDAGAAELMHLARYYARCGRVAAGDATE